MPACPVGRLPPDFMKMTLYDLAEALDRGVLQIDLGETICIRAAYLGVPISISSPSYEETWRLEQIHSHVRHWLARFRRRTLVVSKSVEMVDLSIALFARFRINGSLRELLPLAA